MTVTASAEDTYRQSRERFGMLWDLVRFGPKPAGVSDKLWVRAIEAAVANKPWRDVLADTELKD